MYIAQDNPNKAVQTSHNPEFLELKNRLNGYSAFIGNPGRNENELDYFAKRDQYLQRSRTIRSKTAIKLFSSLLVAFKDGLDSMIRRYQEKAAIDRLSRLNDHYLKDIGVTRGDISALRAGVISVEEFNQQRRDLSTRQSDLKPVQPVSVVKKEQVPAAKTCANDVVMTNAA